MSRRPQAGFALVVTVSMMVLLTVVALGMLSLSSISLRGSSLSSAEERARANARMALMMAINHLQMEMGPDQRVSANGAILGDPASTSDSSIAHPHWTGVWNSWKAGESESSQHSTIGDTADADMHPSYDSPSEQGRSDYFRSWLVSLPKSVGTNLDQAKSLTLDASLMPSLTEDAVILVSDGSLGKDADSNDQVKAPLVTINDNGSELGTGRYGWWVGDESQKARIMADSYESSSALTDADKIFRVQAPGSMGNATVRGLEGITNEEQLDRLPSLKTLDFVNVNPEPADDAPMVSQLNFHHATLYSNGVLADVREGGLKRDLSTILEQPIRLEDKGTEFMLYEFDDPRFPDRANSRVPIQDLASYYQLYDNEPTFSNQRRGGVKYDSTNLANSIQLGAPDFDGGNKNRDRILEEYTTLYRQPVITKIQYLLALGAQPIDDEDKQDVLDQISGATKVQWNGPPSASIRGTDTHRLRVGMMPMITLWNPNNVPLVMDSAQILNVSNPPPIRLRWLKYRGGGADFESKWFTMSFLASGGIQNYGFSSGYSLMRLSFAGAGAESVVFEPGEVKTFSFPASTGSMLNNGEDSTTFVAEGGSRKVYPGYDPFGFFLMRHSAPYGSNSEPPDVFLFTTSGGPKNPESNMVFNASDSISLYVDHDVGTGHWASGSVVAAKSQIGGAAFAFSMTDPGYTANWQDRLDFLRHYAMVSRHSNNRDNADRNKIAAFNEQLMTPGFPGGKTPIAYNNSTNAVQGDQLIGASRAGEVIGMFEFSLSLGCEAGTNATGGFGGGRRIASRPFLHAPIAAPPFIDQADDASLYNYGWDWQLGTVNNVEDSIVQAKPGTENGFYGGGYTVEAGTTHLVQREIPVLPPISVASLSHAHLGGFSMARNAVVGDDPDAIYGKNRVNDLQGTDYQKTTATGQGGLAPHVVQAIGNSYAHPNIAADKAVTNWTRHFDSDPGEGPVVVPFVDHSYLANKALWDEFFFSSIAPQPSKVPLFEGTGRTAKEVADQFFQLSDSSPSIPLPNRRIKAYATDLDQDDLDALFVEATLFTDGLADKIAAHLMVEGAFNINSTSVDAWKVFLSSLKGKPVAYLESGDTPEEATPEGTTVSLGSLTNTEPIKSEDISGPNTPPTQWTSGRELTDEEIGEIATAMVKQVKLRGPFLSLSEFVNRRLQTGNPDLAKMGALQAALNDPDVSINANFRSPSRMMDAEAADIAFDFQEAAEGPIAYGSSAYVDQADILRSFAGQLTPRGDTFVIRAYGDSLDANGKVEARAWCEATIQRVPEYVDASDEPYVKAANLNPANQGFGRKLLIQSFRWLNSNEV